MSDLHVVFGATGGAGGAVVRALAGQGRRVRAVSRRGIGQELRTLDGVEEARADATDPGAVRKACKDAAVVYHCVNVPYSEWQATLPTVMDAMIDGAADTGATLVYCDNLYMYGPVDGPMTEATPAAADRGKGRLRALLADRLLGAHAAGRLAAAIGRGSDFYGPGASNTVAGQLVFPAVVAWKKAHWIGALDQPHSLNYIDDFARGLIVLGDEPAAHGDVWHLPPGPAPTGREFIQMAFAATAQAPKVGVYGRWSMRLVALFDRQMREALEILYQFERPFVLDASKFERAFPDFETTPMPDAIGRTIEWERSQG